MGLGHVFYALFESPSEAAAAEREASALASDQPFEFLHHPQTYDTEQAPLRETRATSGIVVYALVGALLLLAIAGLALGLRALPASILPIAAVVGLAIGAFAGIFVGPTLPDRGIERLNRKVHEGTVLVTVTAPTVEAAWSAEAIFREHGAAIEEHGIL